jgi:hypothetical protein
MLRALASRKSRESRMFGGVRRRSEPWIAISWPLRDGYQGNGGRPNPTAIGQLRRRGPCPADWPSCRYDPGHYPATSANDRLIALPASVNTGPTNCTTPVHTISGMLDLLEWRRRSLKEMQQTDHRPLRSKHLCGEGLTSRTHRMRGPRTRPY